MGNVKLYQKNRQAIAHLAARYIAVEGINDYFSAKCKAAEKLGFSQPKYLPNNLEIEKAVSEYQKIFQQHDHPRILYYQRQHAIHIMNLFNDFRPHLVGPVLSGTSTQYSEITIYLYSDSTEEIRTRLIGNDIVFDDCEYRVKIDNQTAIYRPAFRFMVNEFNFLLAVFPLKQLPHPPVSPINGKSMERANLLKTQKLLDNLIP